MARAIAPLNDSVADSVRAVDFVKEPAKLSVAVSVFRKTWPPACSSAKKLRTAVSVRLIFFVIAPDNPSAALSTTDVDRAMAPEKVTDPERTRLIDRGNAAANKSAAAKLIANALLI